MYEDMENSLAISNSSVQPVYNEFCQKNDLPRHPARMQIGLT